MKKLLTLFAVLLTGCLSLPVQAAEIVTATMTFSGTPNDGDTVVVNSTTRTWKTTVVTASTQVEIDGQNGSALNLYNHYVNFPETGLRAVYNDADIVTLSTFPTTTISSSETGTAVTIVETTVTLTQSAVIRVPFSSVNDTGSTNRQFLADNLVLGLNDHNTEVFEFPDGAASTPGLSFQSDVNSGIYWTAADTWHLGANGANQLTIYNGAVYWTGSLNGTNGTLVDMLFTNPDTTDLVNTGNAISSPGSGTLSEQFGTDANAEGAYSIAIGNGAGATNDYNISIGFESEVEGTYSIGIGSSTVVGPAQAAVAIGYLSGATNTGSLALGSAAAATGLYGVALGSTTEATANYSVAVGYLADSIHTNTIAIGHSSSATHSNSVAIGTSATTTADHQIRLGTSSEFVSIPGNLDVGGVLYSPNLQDTAFVRFDNTALASGNNAAISISTNSFVRISSGPGAAFTINGIAGGRDGRQVTIYNATTYNMTLANDSGTDPTPGNRIYTLTGSDYATTGTGSATVIYDSGASRWILISTRD